MHYVFLLQIVFLHDLVNIYLLTLLHRFQFVLSPRPTPATLYLLKRVKWAANEEIAKLNQIEVCPKAMELTQSIAKRISSDGGGALIIDYGLNGVVSDSLQVSSIALDSLFLRLCLVYGKRSEERKNV